MTDNDSPIGVFDSGVGGISVLRQIVKLMPDEKYIFFGDSKNAPYGVKPVETIKELTFKNVETLLKMGVKAIVVACNTATSAAVRDLRIKYKNIPIVGIEPALKPATTMFPNGKIAVMATPMTIKQEKFNNLLERFKRNAEVVKVPCPGLMDYIESGELKGIRIEKYLRDVLLLDMGEEYDGIVLGCTHYPFIEETLRKVTNDKPVIFDGAYGTAREIKRRIEEAGLRTSNPQKNLTKIIDENTSYNEDAPDNFIKNIKFITTDDDPSGKINLMKMLFTA